MSVDLNKRLVIGVSSRTLFDLSKENEIFEKEGVKAYSDYQIEHENEVLQKGPGFHLIESLLKLNDLKTKEMVEVVIMSRNSPDTSLRVFNSIKHYGLNITRAALVSGASLAPYLNAFKTDLFLSAYEDDVSHAIDSNIAAGIICLDGAKTYGDEPKSQIRIAFDGDAVLFHGESEQIFKEQGLEAFEKNEEMLAKTPLKEGPFANFLRTISSIQSEYLTEPLPIRTALVTARSAPAHERVLRTLRQWGVRVDEVFFLGGVPKAEILKAFHADIFFDDQKVHTDNAKTVVLAARVPNKTSA